MRSPLLNSLPDKGDLIWTMFFFFPQQENNNNNNAAMHSLAMGKSVCQLL